MICTFAESNRWTNLKIMDESTQFAPALRSSIEAILNDNELVASQKLFSEIFGAMAGISAIINNNRQVVYANNEFLDFLGLKSLEPVLGKRAGEIVSCIHSAEGSGCGTSKACKYCGAVNTILESQRTSQKSSKETRISSFVDGRQMSWDLNITTVPIILANQTFYVLTLQDISNEKRITMIERIFFHDLLNTASGLNGLLSILKNETDPEEVSQLVSQSEEASHNIIEEILIYRQLRAAESGDIQVCIELVNALEILGTSVDRISYHEAAMGKQVVIAENSADISFQTDRTLLRRVLINLLKNAIEATPVGGVVTAWVADSPDKIRFWVKNAGVIPQDIQMQIFQRSFSTKGNGRGIGTYSIRLLTENYLKGSVSFVSNESEETVFSVELNKNW